MGPLPRFNEQEQIKCQEKALARSKGSINTSYYHAPAHGLCHSQGAAPAALPHDTLGPVSNSAHPSAFQSFLDRSSLPTVFRQQRCTDPEVER